MTWEVMMRFMETPRSQTNIMGTRLDLKEHASKMCFLLDRSRFLHVHDMFVDIFTLRKPLKHLAYLYVLGCQGL